MWLNERSWKLEISFWDSWHQWRSSGGERAVDPLAQLMMTYESSNMWVKGIPIIWEECKRAHRPSNSAFVLEPYPTPSAKSRWWVSFMNKLYPIPAAEDVEAPSKKPHGKVMQGGSPICLAFLWLSFITVQEEFTWALCKICWKIPRAVTFSP